MSLYFHRFNKNAKAYMSTLHMLVATSSFSSTYRRPPLHNSMHNVQFVYASFYYTPTFNGVGLTSNGHTQPTEMYRLTNVNIYWYFVYCSAEHIQLRRYEQVGRLMYSRSRVAMPLTADRSYKANEIRHVSWDMCHVKIKYTGTRTD